MVEITAGHRMGVAEREQGNREDMRVVHVCPTPFGPGGLLGGGERYPLELARAAARYLPCELVTFGDRAQAWQDPSGLRIRVLHRLGLFREHPAHPIAPQLAWRLGDADVVHTHHTRSAPSRLAVTVALATGRRRVTTDHGLGGGGWAGLLPELFQLFLTVSEFSGDVLGVPADRVRVIYGGVDPERFDPDGGAARDGVLYLGRITPHKGVDRLIRALPRGASLTIAGSIGHDRKAPESSYPRLLRGLAEGRQVTFAGPVAETDIPHLYRRAAVFALPTVETTCYGKPVAITELLGLSVLEAMASGTPVVASRTGALPEVVVDGETGFLVAPGDVEQLQLRLEQLLKDPALARRMGSAARQRALDMFTWDRAAQRCVAAYEELL
jgi:glycosyltransferase involved in cell wall biosynthesis